MSKTYYLFELNTDELVLILPSFFVCMNSVLFIYKKLKFWQYWESWPRSLFYAPLSVVWGWYCLRSRSFWFFSSSNPTLTLGGFEGEGKKEMYEQLPPGSYPVTIFCTPMQDMDSILSAIYTAGLNFPMAAKPDVGMKGLLFRKIDNMEQLAPFINPSPLILPFLSIVCSEIRVNSYICTITQLPPDGYSARYLPKHIR